MLTSTGQSNRIFLILACSLLPLFVSAEFLQAQDKPAQVTEKLAPPEDFMQNVLPGLKAGVGGGIAEQSKLFAIPGLKTKAVKVDSPQQVLRSTARTLEELAADLEQVKFYDKADELRKTAAQYWSQARTMD
ncbi:hypothetical protein N9Y42_11140 [Mariniblastus sp.]|nr:hypothetical protein [Mariniblastus sp.]